MLRIRHEHGEVGARTGQNLVEQIARARNRRRAAQRPGQGAPRGYHCGQEGGGIEGRRRVVGLALDGHHDDMLAPGRQIETEHGARTVEPLRPRPEGQACSPLDGIQAAIGKIDATLADARLRQHAALGSLLAARLEKIGKVRAERHAQADGSWLGVEVMNDDSLIDRALPNEFEPLDVQHVLGERDLVALEVIRIGQVDDERGIVALHRRGQHHRTGAFEAHLAMRKMARILVIDAVRVAVESEQVSARMKHGEGIAVLQARRGVGVERCARRDVELRFRVAVRHDVPRIRDRAASGRRMRRRARKRAAGSPRRSPPRSVRKGVDSSHRAKHRTRPSSRR